MHRGLSLGVVGVLAIGVALAAILRPSCAEGPNRDASARQHSLTVVYPEEWKTSLDTATAKGKFRVILPNHELANGGNITAAYVWPSGNAVALQFPPPSPDARVRQPYIEVWESPWTGGDPVKGFQVELVAAPAVGKSITSVSGIPALSVTARSSSDTEAANPAFLRFVLEGTEIHISGGESLSDLIEIAESMIT